MEKSTTASAVVLVEEKASAGAPHSGYHVCTRVTPLGDASSQVISNLFLEVVIRGQVCTS